MIAIATTITASATEAVTMTEKNPDSGTSASTISTPASEGSTSCEPIEKMPLPTTAVAAADDDTPHDWNMLYRIGRSLGPGITDDTADGPRLASTPRRTASLSTSDAVNAPCRTTHTSQPKASESHSASESSPIALRTSPQSRSSKTLNNTQLDNARTPTMITTRMATLRMVRARDADPCSAGSASAAEVNAGPAGSSAMRRARYQPRDRPLGSPSWGYSLGASNSGMGARPRHGRADHPGAPPGRSHR